MDGWLIKSENYQALNTLLPKFKEKVQTIYIDPPFNTGNDFDYVDKFQDSVWLILLDNRISLSKNYLKDSGAFFLHLDYNSNFRGRELLNNIFGKENFRNEIIWTYGGKGLINVAKKFAPYYSSILFFSKNKDKLLILNKQIGEISHSVMQRFGKLMNENFQITFGELKKHHEKSELKKAEKRFIKEFGREPKDDEIAIDYSKKGTILKDVWMDIGIVRTSPKYKEFTGFETQKPELLLKRIIESTSNENDFVMDFFSGSGTTVAVAHKLKRKWIGTEMGEHFYTVILPRMKRVLAYDKSGISKEKDVKEKYNEKSAGGFFKYYELEQYEETLANTVYEDNDTSIFGDKTPYEQHIFMKDEKMLKVLETDCKNRKVKVNLDKLYPNIDIAETLSNLTGKWIKKIEEDQVEFEDGGKVNIKDLDYKLIKPLIWWE